MNLYLLTSGVQGAEPSLVDFSSVVAAPVAWTSPDAGLAAPPASGRSPPPHGA